jgi:ribosomal protein L29
MSFSTHEFLEDRVHELEQEILRLKRELADARAALPQDRRELGECDCAG